LRKAVLRLLAGGVPSTAMAARIADSTHTDSVVRTSEVLAALADGICGSDERTNPLVRFELADLQSVFAQIRPTAIAKWAQAAGPSRAADE
jgi:hypothetical protein